MNAVVFIGPSMAHEDCRKIFEAEYRPPVKRGDLNNLPEGTDTVAIVDGVMLNSSAVAHREILSLLNSGIHVFGAGSMGALRAAELESFGMIGSGRIYEEYSSGRVTGDDEVVLFYDPFSLAALSEPLINFRLNLETAVSKKMLSASIMEEALCQMKKTYYPRRNQDRFKEIMRTLLDEKEYESFYAYWNQSYHDFKRSDAEEILRLLALK